MCGKCREIDLVRSRACARSSVLRWQPPRVIARTARKHTLIRAATAKKHAPSGVFARIAPWHRRCPFLARDGPDRTNRIAKRRPPDERGGHPRIRTVTDGPSTECCEEFALMACVEVVCEGSRSVFGTCAKCCRALCDVAGRAVCGSGKRRRTYFSYCTRPPVRAMDGARSSPSAWGVLNTPVQKRFNLKVSGFYIGGLGYPSHKLMSRSG